jgi:hypothetical protein
LISNSSIVAIHASMASLHSCSDWTRTEKISSSPSRLPQQQTVRLAGKKAVSSHRLFIANN